MPKEYLQKLYNEYLNSDGEVLIESYPFNRSSILSELEPETYSQTFRDWENQRKDTLSIKANEILKLYDNEKRFAKLKKAIKSNGVIPFIGAGLSVPSDYPSWTAFLYRLIEESQISEEKLDAILQEGKYEEAAQKIYEDIDGELFNELLENEFSHEREVFGAVNYLPVLFQQHSILTTNFDNLLEKVFCEKDNGFDEVKSGKNLEEVLRKIASGSRILIKLHGDCMQVLDRVLTQEEYEKTYADGKVLVRFFNRIMYKGSMLFLGCSLSSDRTILTMKSIVKEEGADGLPRNYAFLEEIKDSDQRRIKIKDLAKANIFPIWYPEGDHDESLEALFIKLLED